MARSHASHRKVGRKTSSQIKPPDTNVTSLISEALAVPHSTYTLEETLFMLWYTLTTTLNPDKIAEFFNGCFSDSTDRWEIAQVVDHLIKKWEKNEGAFGKFNLKRPSGYGACPCDFGVDCANIKRSTKTRQNLKYLTMASSLWAETARDLVICPRQRQKEKERIIQKQRKFGQIHFPTWLQVGLAIFIHHLAKVLQVTIKTIIWLIVMISWLVEPEELPYLLQGTYARYLHLYPAPTLAITKLALEELCTVSPSYSRIRFNNVHSFLKETGCRFLILLVGISLALMLIIHAEKDLKMFPNLIARGLFFEFELVMKKPH